MQITELLAILFLLLLLVAAVYLALNLRQVTVYEFERGLLYQQGRFRRLLGAGSYWTLRQWQMVYKIDMRLRYVTLSGQEVLSADNIGLKITLAAAFKVVDPLTALQENANYQEALYLQLQLALRDRIGALAVDDLLSQRQTLGTQILEETRPLAERLGLKLESVGLKDIMFPGDLKAVFAQVVNARKEGQAALERARAESAALRNLANAATLMEQQPELFRLRLLQTLGSSSGHTLLLQLGKDEITLLPHEPAKVSGKKGEKA